jgi:histidine ammonia-lyase
MLETNNKDVGPHHHGIVVLTGNSLNIEDVVAVARERARVAPLSPTRRAIESRQWVERAIAGEITDRDGDPLAVYGVNTPFGSLAYKNVFKTPQEAQKLSRNLITSHSAGVGRYFSEDVVRAATLIRANTLAKGLSGIRPEVVNSLLHVLNANIYPAVPEKGSLGASGDLAPLSHLALVISKPPLGPDKEDESGQVLVPFDPERHRPADCVVVGDAFGQGVLRVKASAKSVMEDAGIPRWVLQAKEGLALNNGATFSAAMAALAVHDAELLIKNAEIALAMTVEAVRGYRDAFLPQVHKARGHRGQIDCAANVLRLIESSSLVCGDQDANPENPPPQDAYSIRCAPQVIGAVRDVVAWVRGIVETELNAATDNPLIFASEDMADEYHLPRSCKAVSCGNFHGEPLALAMDFLKIAIAELGNIVERRVFRLLTETLNRNLDAMLVHSPEDESGMRNGYMIAQYTAAALVSDNKTLAHPDSVDSIPTCEDQEDHVSMSPNAGRHAREVIWNVQQIVGIEMLCAAQALDFRKEGKEYVQGCEAGRVKNEWRQVHAGVTLGQGTRVAHDYIRDPERGAIAHWDQDRIMYPELARAALMVSSGEIVPAVEKSLGSPLK